jgi:O-antigen/teichoic acid export membrane protein
MLTLTVRRLVRDSLLRNSSMIMATTAGTSLVGYLYWALAARTMPAAAVGLASTLVSAATVLSLATNLGAGHAFIQHLPRLDVAAWSRAVSTGITAGCAATGVAALAAVAALPVFSAEFAALRRPATAALVVAAAVTLTAATLLDYVSVAQRASGGMLARNVAFAVGKLALLAAVGLPTVDGVLLSWVMASLAVTAGTAGWLLPRLRPGMRFTLTGAPAELRRLRRSLAGHHLINLTQAVPGLLLPVLVTARLGAADGGYFYLTWMVGSALFMVSPAVASALFAERSHAATATVRRAALIVAAVLAVPFAVLLAGRHQVLSVFGPGYAGHGAALLAVLVLAAVPDAVTNLAVGWWRSEGRLGRCLGMNAVMATVCLVGAWKLLPVAGILGAGLAWLAAQCVGSVLVAVLVGRR